MEPISGWAKNKLLCEMERDFYGGKRQCGNWGHRWYWRRWRLKSIDGLSGHLCVNDISIMVSVKLKNHLKTIGINSSFSKFLKLKETRLEWKLNKMKRFNVPWEGHLFDRPGSWENLTSGPQGSPDIFYKTCADMATIEGSRTFHDTKGRTD